MAKGARSSVKKRNKATLRAAVFGPAADRRTERLSAKLQELSSQTLVKDAEMADADFNLIEKPEQSSTAEGESSKDMEIDGTPSASKSGSGEAPSGTGRIHKRVRRKTRPSITFKKPLAGKAKGVHKKK